MVNDAVAEFRVGGWPLVLAVLVSRNPNVKDDEALRVLGVPEISPVVRC